MRTFLVLLALTATAYAGTIDARGRTDVVLSVGFNECSNVSEDFSPNQHTISMANQTCVTMDSGNGIAHNGSNTTAQTEATTDFDFSKKSTFTWLWKGQVLGGGTEVIIMSNTGATANGVMFAHTNGKLHSTFYGVAANDAVTAMRYGSDYCAALTWDNLLGRIYLYDYDGPAGPSFVLDKTFTNAGPLATGAQTFKIGHSPSKTTLNGKTDEAMVFKRSLTPDEIKGVCDRWRWPKVQE